RGPAFHRLSDFCRPPAFLRPEGDKIEGENLPYKGRFSDDLNREVLQEFSIQVIGPLNFIVFRS
ncbi:MAG: hypothetical protein KH366_22455, partial [Clostridiaceae bacterium]|nr:hypothetical protein [Clostridiaceae bacterium]